jgi:signal transduction histidine kinase
MSNGSDLRTVELGNGTRVRMLTYRLAANGADMPAMLQLGRTLGDQDRTLNQLLLTLLALGGASAVMLALASWALAGRSIRPAHEAWEKQKAFIANASHELRAPLTLVRAGAETALRHTPANSKGQRETLQDVLDECDHMGRLVEDLLLMSRLDAGRVDLQTELVDVDALMNDVQRQVGRVAGERGVQVTIEARGATVKADRTQLRQVLLILLDNALRHTPPGGTITLSAAQHDRGTVIEVADTGSGIAPEHLPHVFEPFYSVGNSPNGTSSGLGLSIAGKLVEAHGGRISIASQPGRGTRVAIAL